MTRKLDIETNLDRSLAKQIKAPQLNRGFDAAVWARIEAAEQNATNPVFNPAQAPSSARWLFISNVIGMTVAAVLVVMFGLQSFSGVTVTVPTLDVSAGTSKQILEIAGLAVTAVSVVFGLMFTPLGRRLRAEFT
jgi:hypothetical protein